MGGSDPADTAAKEPLAAEPATAEIEPAARPTGGEAALTIDSRDHATASARPRPREARTQRPRRRRDGRALSRLGGRLAGMAAAAAVVLGLLALPAIVAGRSAIVRSMPRTAVLFERLGLPVNLVGLVFAEVTSSVSPGEKGASVLVVEGRIDNIGREEVSVPRLAIQVQGEAGESLYAWSVAAAEPRLAAGQATRFRARLASPPPAGRSVSVTFRPGEREAVVASR